jgi:hypothetical protein
MSASGAGSGAEGRSDARTDSTKAKITAATDMVANLSVTLTGKVLRLSPRRWQGMAAKPIQHPFFPDQAAFAFTPGKTPNWQRLLRPWRGPVWNLADSAAELSDGQPCSWQI